MELVSVLFPQDWQLSYASFQTPHVHVLHDFQMGAASQERTPDSEMVGALVGLAPVVKRVVDSLVLTQSGLMTAASLVVARDVEMKVIAFLVLLNHTAMDFAEKGHTMVDGSKAIHDVDLLVLELKDTVVMGFVVVMEPVV